MVRLHDERWCVLDRLLGRIGDRDGAGTSGLLGHLGLLLRGLGRPEELGERALTHACALSRH